jgi:beta-glucosidase
VQLYLSDPVARITRPGRMLSDFRQVTLAPGETRTVRFEVTHAMTRYVVAPSLEAAEEVWDPGVFILHVGPNSRDTRAVELRWDA